MKHLLLAATLIICPLTPTYPPEPGETWVCRVTAIHPEFTFDFIQVDTVLEHDVVVEYEDDCPRALGLAAGHAGA